MINFNRVSDIDYMNDFDNANVFGANTTTIVQSGSVAYNDENWNTSVLAQTYQVLDQNLYVENTPYSLLPQINVAANYPSTIKYLDYGFNSQLTDFYKSPLATGDDYPVTGIRTYINPFISAPLKKQWGGITPKIVFNQTNYNLGHTQNNGYPDSQINRSIPILTVDSNLNLFRNYIYKDTPYQQTLTPRLFYTYIPYKNQSNIPLFDTSYSNFSYSSLFNPNRFTGADRINNANQLSYALETSINQKDNGNILFRGGIGQMIYFQPQKVTLSTTDQSPYYQNKLSDIAGFMSYQFIDDWYMNTSFTYNQYLRQLDTQSYAIQYMPDEDHIFNISYSNILGNYSLLTSQQLQEGVSPPNTSQITTSALWKLTNHWATVGLINYDFISKRTTNMYAGVQYNAASWVFKLLYQRYVNIDNDPNNPAIISGPLNTSIVFQITLKGLGSPLSQGNSDQLLNLVPGYNPDSVFSSQ
jgi:LPS-assembly protein